VVPRGGPPGPPQLITEGCCARGWRGRVGGGGGVPAADPGWGGGGVRPSAVDDGGGGGGEALQPMGALAG